MADEVNETARFEFHLETNYVEEAVQRIRALQEADIRHPTSFYLNAHYLTDAILLELYRTFATFELKGIHWESLEIILQPPRFEHQPPINHLLLGDVMRVVHRASLFECITLHSNNDLQDNLRIFPSLETSNRLKSLELDSLRLGADDIHSLSHVLRQCTLESIDIYYPQYVLDFQAIHDALFEVLSSNSTLAYARFQYKKSSELVQKLIGHPALKELYITDNDVNSNSYLEALPALLTSDNCRLESLHLSCHGGLDSE